MSARSLYLDRTAVAEFVALSESTIEKLVRENEFPKPRILSGRRVA
ncbi:MULTISPECIES: helix-turn-helix transcriptional regulator [unclassified Variovorax]